MILYKLCSFRLDSRVFILNCKLVLTLFGLVWFGFTLKFPNLLTPLMLNFIIKIMLCDNAQHYVIRVLYFVKPFFTMPIKLLKSEFVNFQTMSLFMVFNTQLYILKFQY